MFGNEDAAKHSLAVQEPALPLQQQTVLPKSATKLQFTCLGGDLQVEVGKTLFLIGAAEKVFQGTLFGENKMNFEYAERIRRLPPYLFAEIEKMQKEKKAQGIDLISLSIGDPDLPPPDFVVEALSKRSY